MARRYSPRDDGCIVTFENAQGERRVLHRWGPPEEVLQEIVAKAKPDEYVASISTPSTIARDLQGPRPDSFSSERTFLGRMGRLDLLDPRAPATSKTHSRTRDRNKLNLARR